MSDAWVVNSDMSMQEFIGDMRDLFRKHKFIRISARVGKDRTIDQNSISHAWYGQIARELREDDAKGWKSYCKLHHGVPILRAEDEEFRGFYDGALIGLTYEQKLAAMAYVPVTSIMTVAQKSKYLEEVQADFLRRGVRLEFPNDPRA